MQRDRAVPVFSSKGNLGNRWNLGESRGVETQVVREVAQWCYSAMVTHEAFSHAGLCKSRESKVNYRASSLSASSERAPTQEVEDLSSLSNNALQAKERIVQA